MLENIFKKIGKLRLILVLLAVGTYATLSYSFTDNYFEISKNLDIFSSTLRELDLYYVDSINPGELVKTGIDAMLASLDPYTDYIPESEIEDYRFMTTGEYGGIGALMQKDSNYLEIAEPYAGSPAARAGLIAGDKVVSVDGISMIGKTVDDIGKLLKGEPGTSVNITFMQPDDTSRKTVTLKRETIKVTNVPYYGMVSNNIGYIRLTEFTEGAGKNVREALVELKKNPNLKGVILDLRNNPGGLLNEAINVVNVFEPKGQLVVNTKGRSKDWNHSDYTNNTAVDTTIPVAVLVNGGSASASEIVTGTIQDLDRGVVVGMRTYGKGLVQQTHLLSYNSQLKFTIAKYYIPSGRCIQALNYSHEGADGGANKVPDSLKTAFRTKHGRVVYDGGGIFPDFIMDPGRFSLVATNLQNKFFIFHYATLYKLSHPSIASPDSFSLSDAEYDKFVAYVKSHSFTYITKSELLLQQLQESTDKEKYSDGLASDYEKIKKTLAEAKKNDFYTNKEDIKQLLEEEIEARYYYQKGRIQVGLKYDTEVAKGVLILNNVAQYDSALTTIAPATRPFHNSAMAMWPPQVKK